MNEEMPTQIEPQPAAETPQAPHGPAVPAPMALPANPLERLRLVKEWMDSKVLIPGEDYGVMPGFSSAKPTLLKPGAQKLCALFMLSTVVKDTKRVWNDSIIAYDITIQLVNKTTGVVEAEGVGGCNSKERRYANKPKEDSANTIQKMAKKRALVDAVLDALGAASILTQDLEDMEPDRPQQAPARQQHQQAHPPAQPQQAPAHQAPQQQPAARPQPAPRRNQPPSQQQQQRPPAPASPEAIQRYNEMREWALAAEMPAHGFQAPPELPANPSEGTVQKWISHLDAEITRFEQMTQPAPAAA